MGRRRRVPAGLRSELSEYSSLLRVLNVSGTLDVTSHLTESHPPTSTSEDDSVQSRDESGDEVMKDLLNDAIPPLSSEFDTDPDHVAEIGMNTRGKSKRTAKERSRTTRVQDTWRWPLLAADVYVPEWGLEDEIKVIATDILKQHSSPPASQHKPGPIQPDERDDQMFDGDDDDDILPMPFADALTLATSAQLSRILAAVVSHVPLSENSMQNRALPIGWLGVLNIVGASELFDEKVLERVEQRLNATYSPSKSQVNPRIDRAFSRKWKFDDFCKAKELSFLTFPDSPRRNTDDE